ncbi:MAG: CDP-alcohol phosphatidyltransferase family protein [Leptolyngbyaceae cyanobacterium MO_188.B28]|nr:CDP-alcohol phosphatidyltransferase family protein [Leptolyngbyaceae cyanobacterium MO_188.B28]
MKNKAIWTIPNILSIYRLVVFPVLIFLTLGGHETIFSRLFFISLITDILDGWIARTFHMESELGAKLDTWADTATYLAGFWAIFSLEWRSIAPHILWIVVFAIAWLASYLIRIIKFRSIVGLHTYNFKITAYLQGACMMGLLWFGYWGWLTYFAIAWGVFACLEEILIVLLLPEAKSNVKGLFWVLREGWLWVLREANS